MTALPKTEVSAPAAVLPDKKNDRFVVLISHERSGSHYFTDLLASTGQIRSLDEICNFNAVNPDTGKASFFRFRNAAQQEDPDISLRPSIGSMSRLLDRYFEFLSSQVPEPKKILLDIKYGHVHNFEVGWWPSERRPFLLAWLEQSNVPVVHLTRRDSLAASVSNLIAEQRNVWHRKTEKDRGVSPMQIPVQKAVQEALLLEREKDNFFNWLGGVRRVHVEYEELAGDQPVRDRAMKRICAFLEIEAPAEFASAYRKVTPPLEKVLGNYDQLMRTARLFGQGRLRNLD